MIKFSWPKILKETDGDIKLIMQGIKSRCSEYHPISRKDILYKYKYVKDFNGDSYLLNPIDLIENLHVSGTFYAVQYVYLASKRSYPRYILTGDSTLDLYLNPFEETVIQQNPLLIVSRDRIKFKYEELK